MSDPFFVSVECKNDCGYKCRFIKPAAQHNLEAHETLFCPLRKGASPPPILAESGQTGIKDSGERVEYASGMRRDTTDGKTNYLLLRDGPMLERWALHLTGGAKKYGDRNWMLADSEEELERFKSSACRHFEQFLRGDTDEDHAAACVFNINAVERLREKLDLS